MSTDEQSAVGADTPQTVEERLGDMEERLSAMEMDVKQAANLAKDALDTANQAVEQTDTADEDLRKEVADLESRFDDLADRTDLLKRVKQASSLSSEKKAAVCLQTLVAEAQAGDGFATLTAREAKKTLGGDVDRTLMYKVLPKAAELVDDDEVAWYEKEDRSSPKNSRLVVDLTAGEVPGSVAGFELTGGSDL